MQLAVSDCANDSWSTDFMHDHLAGRGRFRSLTVIDDYNCDGLGLVVELSLAAAQVVRTVDRIIKWRAEPQFNRYDNGGRSIGGALLKRLEQYGIGINNIKPGKPQWKVYIERLQSNCAI